MDTLNLVDLVRGNLSGGMVNKLGSFLGEDSDKTQAGLNSAIPGLLSGFDNLASTTDGSKRLASAVNDADDGILSGLGNMFGSGFSTDTGAAVLRSLIGGGGFSELSGNVGRSSGLSGKAVASLLGVVAPIVLGTLKKLVKARGLDAAGLANLFSSQRSNIAAAMPAGMPGRFTATETTYTREPLRDISYQARGIETDRDVREPTPKRSSLGWILPLLALAGLIGLLWNWASRTSVRAGREESRVTERRAATDDSYRYGTRTSFERLKAKYQSVLTEAQSQGVQISSLHERNGKLVIEGTAPSLEAANKVWDQIKRVDPRMADLAANISVKSAAYGLIPPIATSEGETKKDVSEGMVHRTKPAEPSDMSTSYNMDTYTVKPGDTLSLISKHFYGNTQDYMRIFDANRDKLKDQNTISVGQELSIPAK